MFPHNGEEVRVDRLPRQIPHAALSQGNDHPAMLPTDCVHTSPALCISAPEENEHEICNWCLFDHDSNGYIHRVRPGWRRTWSSKHHHHHADTGASAGFADSARAEACAAAATVNTDDEIAALRLLCATSTGGATSARGLSSRRAALS